METCVLLDFKRMMENLKNINKNNNNKSSKWFELLDPRGFSKPNDQRPTGLGSIDRTLAT